MVVDMVTEGSYQNPTPNSQPHYSFPSFSPCCPCSRLSPQNNDSSFQRYKDLVIIRSLEARTTIWHIPSRLQLPCKLIFERMGTLGNQSKSLPLHVSPFFFFTSKEEKTHLGFNLTSHLYLPLPRLYHTTHPLATHDLPSHSSVTSSLFSASSPLLPNLACFFLFPITHF